MARKRLCPDGSNGTQAKKPKNQPGSSGKKTQLTTPKSSDTAHHRDSAHKNKKIGLFTAESMRKCIEEVKTVEARQKELGLAKPVRLFTLVYWKANWQTLFIVRGNPLS